MRLHTMLLSQIAASTLGFLAFKHLEPRFKAIGLTGIDVHKNWDHVAIELGGIPLLLTLVACYAAAAIAASCMSRFYLAIMLVAVLSFTLGMLDDVAGISGPVKGVVFTLPSVGLFTAELNPYPRLPIVGMTRLTIFYFIIIPIYVSVVANSANMIDVMNGVLPSTCIIMLLGGILLAYFKGSTKPILLSVPMLFTLAVYLYYNWFPAKYFAGNCGSHMIGAVMAGIAILSGLEFYLVMAMLPYVLNSFSYLTSVKGFLERTRLEARPVIVRSGLIYANKDPRAPITLVGLLTSTSPKDEKLLIRQIVLLSVFSTVLSIATEVLLGA
ncbi:MAG: hypothetical protein DRN99_05275 [Thermoproteota archaeon]|nr:MAG: hypothetical protein DRN99_05275 [Candidatus Korarchaeota archaeon]